MVPSLTFPPIFANAWGAASSGRQEDTYAAVGVKRTLGILAQSNHGENIK